MANPTSTSPVSDAAKEAINKTGAQDAATKASSAAGEAKKTLPKQNEAFRMMGLPRLRLPSRNWSIFLGVTGSFFGAMFYDKYQTKLAREKWCKLVSHITEEPLPSHTLARKVTVYLAAPPGDGLRAARDHFHLYVKPVLVAAAMDWDVVEGRKEGDVRWKTAERIRKRRRAGGEGTPDAEEAYSVESIREKAGTQMYDGVGGDVVVGRNTWKEYVRGTHEGWLGPVDAPVVPGEVGAEGAEPATHTPGLGGVGDAAASLATSAATTRPSLSGSTTDSAQSPVATLSETLESAPATSDDASPTADTPAAEEKKDEPPKPRHPPPYINADAYPSATLSALTPEILGPATSVPFPHILGFRNTPIRVYRFLSRRRVADDVGRQVAAAVLASHRPFEATVSTEGGSGSEVTKELLFEEASWWKTTYKPREPHEEAVWIEECTVDERLAGRMRRFELTSVDEERAKAKAQGKEQRVKVEEEG
ncbi:mitochondrial import inner membrane translocase subunit tim54 [Oleoguttula sp. CCFEE 5521]